ncbi:MAG: hypothetical protein A3D24_02640 [Candidatus Blackburnbacteria bacterium RIFCSPHIGHO2_02_FULL_39_13]|uniref:Uncharacterized protein n=1 Tax=Candidatus Blackburnbacteria bacterium RIFCSPLOWO2_01_FULL_40_20 TaxID=1797519 RepID=A0A1G1VEW0_9BACT|nr:MAG: hypothetical protein A2694_00085 [Candidatus Blackburnbacteria bacterium RIFCSPHIGHO2_01_FULL_40_17]OGY09276.1 MAG: hypothetical protein A3D24_02640 [Candidatus Blackburnbacteria bacterium RIFCSPHIGHO2_02_FULL_39_13]OGY13901.1 MAG: hypothetical protein A3A77_01230 [Candidatus Blackburnbacteria bacterium RIFCSPLOWO2_01_FULL_40_20]OGY14931.1 MAG: hypothetical protein A3I52_02660 [Candidatus Blackburnbacteria bacterium RIFCSPLOWO2_02_FULL_40_10]
MPSKLESLTKSRKNFLPTAILTLFLWGAWITIFFFVPPETFLMPIFFLLLTFLCFLFTSSLIFANSRRGLLVATGVILYMILKYFGLINVLNIILIVAILGIVEYYFSNK